MGIKSMALIMATLAVSSSVNAAIVSSSLPYTGTPDWSDVTFSGTTMTTNGTTSTLTTAPVRGVWFGWLASQNPPGTWAPGSSSAGNHLSLEASFSSNATDWSAYFYDQTSIASFGFAETGCNGNINSCYGLTGFSGVSVAHAGATALDYAETLIALDLTVSHTYEFLLKDGLVSYRIDGSVVYSGLAYQSSSSLPFLVIGDGSGSTHTGQGSMTISNVSFDNAPLENVLVSTVPVPAAAWLFGSGLLALVGVSRRNKV